MKTKYWLPLALLCVMALLGLGVVDAAEDAEDEVIQMVIDLVNDKDHDMRALGLQQVREAAKGEAATRRFVALLPGLSSDGQVGLLDALAERADSTAQPAVLELIKSPAEAVRVAAFRTLGALGTTKDVPLLVQAFAASGSENAAAEASLKRLAGQDVNPAIVKEMKQATPNLRKKLIGVLLARRAIDSLDAVADAAVDANAAVRMAAMEMLGQLAGPEQAAPMLRGVLRAEPGAERESAEKAVMFACGRIADANKRAEPLLAAMAPWNADDRLALLPTLGRVGSPAALKVVGEAIADKDAGRRDVGIRALCNWPDATVTAQLMDLAKTANDANHRIAALRALIRVAPLADHRSDAERLDLLKTVMPMATREEDQKLILKRARAIRTIETLRYVVPYMDSPALAQEACETVVELAHHRKLREPNKAEFDKALDAAIRISKDPKVIDYAKRYKKGQT